MGGFEVDLETACGIAPRGLFRHSYVRLDLERAHLREGREESGAGGGKGAAASLAEAEGSEKDVGAAVAGEVPSSC
jgi:hypothetical protein